jgi:Ran GTPase-activating protein (RanGAP) involved in mRNA processing and transport
LLDRIENNDKQLTELVVLPMKTFGESEVKRLASILSKYFSVPIIDRYWYSNLILITLSVLESGNSSNLKWISASGHSLSNESLELLGDAIASQKANGITQIAIGDENMGDEGVQSFCRSLKDVNGGSLECVDFALKSVTKDGAEVIGSVFAASTCFKKLILNRNPNLGSDGLSAICKASLQATPAPFPVLETLNLSQCNIGPEGIDDLEKCLMAGNEKRAIELNIDSNPLGPKVSNALSRMIAETNFHHSILKSLSLKNCAIGDEGLASLASCFLSNPSCLEKLNLSNNNIGESGIKSLSNSIQGGRMNIQQLTEIDFSDNHIGEQGIITFAESMIQEENRDGNSTLTSLDLTNTNCGVGGVTILMKCTALRSLRLFNNKLGSTGIETISNFLIGGHPSLINLDLGGNKANGDSVAKLLKAVVVENDKFKSSLRTLELGGNENNDESLFEETRVKRPELDIPQVKETSNNQSEESS